MASVVRLAPGQVLTPMPPMVHTPRINVVPMPPTAPHVMAPRPPPMVVPAGETVSTRSTVLPTDNRALNSPLSCVL